MTRRLAVPLTLLAFTACADVQHPLAPETIDLNAQVMSDAVWFVTTPPNPAYVGATYQVVVETLNPTVDLYSLASVCPLSNQTKSGNQVTATVSFVETGTCRLAAWDPYMIDYAEQVFEVVARTPAPVPTPAPPTPVNPRMPPRPR
jgi:hypothetical protein